MDGETDTRRRFAAEEATKKKRLQEYRRCSSWASPHVAGGDLTVVDDGAA